MRKFLRIAGAVLGLVLLVAFGTAAYFLLWKDGPPAKRPDLVRLPEGAPEAPAGYHTPYGLYLAFAMKSLKLVDLAHVTVPEDVTEKTGIEYGRVGDKPLLLDLYQPVKMDRPLPGLIFIHGGGWAKGDRKDYKCYTVRFAQRGYVVATAGYRFAPETTFPGCVEDIKCAVRWMRENAAQLHVDPDRIAVIGGSAGGYLSMMAAYSSDVPELEGNGGHPGVSSRVAAVVDLYGPTDLTVPFAQEAGVVQDFLGKKYMDDPALYHRASPITYLDANDPPTLIFQGTIDSIVPPDQSDLLAEKLQQLKVKYYYARLDGWPHTMDAAVPVNAYSQALIAQFLEEVLKPAAVH